MRIKDVRKFVFQTVKHLFKVLVPNNISLAIKRNYLYPDGSRVSEFKSLDDNPRLSIADLVKLKAWKRDRVELKYKEEQGCPINVPKYLETLYVRFVPANS